MSQECCYECGKKFGSAWGLRGVVQAEEGDLNRYRQLGINVPSPLCYACSVKYKEEAKKAAEVENTRITESIPLIGVFTYPPEHGKNFEGLGTVTAHVILGTGPLAALKSSVSDLFGEESSVYDEKMQQATNACMDKFKLNAAKMGATAIYGTQISYSELTAGHGMIMVCMTGTAVRDKASQEE